MPYEWLSVAFAVVASRGIEPHEVMQVLYGTRRRPVAMVHPGGLTFVDIWGRTRAGRPLIVTTRPADGSGRDSAIVGAREMTAAERREYESWETTR